MNIKIDSRKHNSKQSATDLPQISYGGPETYRQLVDSHKWLLSCMWYITYKSHTLLHPLKLSIKSGERAGW